MFLLPFLKLLIILLCSVFGLPLVCVNALLCDAVCSFAFIVSYRATSLLQGKVLMVLHPKVLANNVNVQFQFQYKSSIKC
jgi:hypothetical protein